MSENSNAGPQPGTYVKDGAIRFASRTRDAVALVFEGYKLQVEEAPSEPESAEEPEQELAPEPVVDTPAPRRKPAQKESPTA